MSGTRQALILFLLKNIRLINYLPINIAFYIEILYKSGIFERFLLIENSALKSGIFSFKYELIM